jgi:predicted dehydrogenase
LYRERGYAMEKDIGIGVIGVGMGLDLLYLNDNPNSRFQVRGLCAAHLDKVKRAGKKHGIAFTTDDYRALIEREDIQVVVVFSPDHLHALHIKRALNAGKHVVVTKPMVTSLEDALEIVKLTEKTGLKFLVGETCRFYTSFIAVRKMFEDGDLGDLIFGEAHYVHDLREIIPLTPWRIEVPQDFMYGGCCHPVDSLVWFFGEAEEVQAYGIKSGVNPTYPLEDTYLLNIRFASGKLARVLGAYGVVEPPMPMMGLNIYGTRGSAVADFHDFKPTWMQVVLDKFDTKPVLKMDVPADMKGAYGQGEAVRRYMTNFEACLTDGASSAIDAREGAKTIAILSAAWESIRSGGKPVTVLRDF